MMLYGMSAGALMVRLGMTMEAAQKVTKDYWRAFPRTKPWTHEIMDECAKNGMIRYWSKRIWREENEADTYKGVNAAIQGGCADLLSIAAIRADMWLREQGPDYGIVSLIHDELLMEVPIGEQFRVAKEVGRIMQVPDLLGIPFLTEAKIGPSYGKLEKQKL